LGGKRDTCLEADTRAVVVVVVVVVVDDDDDDDDDDVDEVDEVIGVVDDDDEEEEEVRESSGDGDAEGDGDGNCKFPLVFECSWAPTSVVLLVLTLLVSLIFVSLEDELALDFSVFHTVTFLLRF
jgi:hypothetical protein